MTNLEILKLWGQLTEEEKHETIKKIKEKEKNKGER